MIIPLLKTIIKHLDTKESSRNKILDFSGEKKKKKPSEGTLCAA